MNIAAEVIARCDERPDAIGLVDQRSSLTFGSLGRRMNGTAEALRGRGVRPGDRVVLIVPTVLEFAVLYYGALAAGATVVTVNPVATEAEIDYVVADASPALVVAWPECAAHAEAVAARRGVPAWTVAGEGLIDEIADATLHDYDPEDTAVIIYTSGTTGRPKGAELTMANLSLAAALLREITSLGPDDCAGTALPLFHVFGQSVVLNSALTAGASVALLSRFEPHALLDLVAAAGVTVLVGVPTMWHGLLAAVKESGAADLESLRLAISGGASMPAVMLEEFETRLGCRIVEGYGLTETTAVLAFSGAVGERRPGTVGPALRGGRIEIRDGDGRPLPPGEVGEVFYAGPTVTKGYWNRPEETATAIVDGWLRTGDLGTLDGEGYLTLVGRAKELIIRGGYNVYPREVEDVLARHPAVSDVAVVGVPDERLGEEIAAVVVLRHGAAATDRDLRAWASQDLSPYKVPRKYKFVSGLPVGSTGKVLKREIDIGDLRTTGREGG